MNNDQQTSNTNNSGGIFGSSPMSMTDQDVAHTAQDQSDQNLTNDVPDHTSNYTKNQPVPNSKKTEDEFISLNQSANFAEVSEEQDPQKELENLGITVVGEEGSTHEPNVFDLPGNTVNTVHKEAETPKNQQPASQLLEKKNDIDTKSLEDDFSKTFSDEHLNSPEFEDVSLDSEEQKLQDMHDKLQAKASKEKAEIKQELERLKKEKEKIGTRLEGVKKIETVATQIKDKLDNLKKLDDDIDSLEEKAKEELQ